MKYRNTRKYQQIDVYIYQCDVTLFDNKYSSNWTYHTKIFNKKLQVVY